MPHYALCYRPPVRKTTGVPLPGSRDLATQSTLSKAIACSHCGCHGHNTHNSIHQDNNSTTSTTTSHRSKSDQLRDTRRAKNTCLICKKSIQYFLKELTCGHQFHMYCYIPWLRVRTNVPDEHSLCPKCGFLEPVRPSHNKMANGLPASSRRIKHRRVSSSSGSSTTSTSSSASSSSSSSSSSASDISE